MKKKRRYYLTLLKGHTKTRGIFGWCCCFHFNWPFNIRWFSTLKMITCFAEQNSKPVLKSEFFLSMLNIARRPTIALSARVSLSFLCAMESLLTILFFYMFDVKLFLQAKIKDLTFIKTRFKNVKPYSEVVLMDLSHFFRRNTLRKIKVRWCFLLRRNQCAMQKISYDFIFG